MIVGIDLGTTNSLMYGMHLRDSESRVLRSLNYDVFAGAHSSSRRPCAHASMSRSSRAARVSGFFALVTTCSMRLR